MLGTWRISVERLPPTRAEITAIYDWKASHWSAVIRWLGSDQAYRNLFRRLEQSLVLGHLRHGERVLDCRIGTGTLSLALFEGLPFKVHLTGLDLSPQMIEEASRRLTSAGAKFDLYCPDVSSLPLGGEKFVLVMWGHLLEHLPDPLGQ